MDQHEHHEQLLKEVSEEYEDILENSEQGIYIYFDDNHKICNEKFAEMLGYTLEEWQKPAEFIATYVADESGKRLVSAYQDSIQKAVGSAIEVTWKKKDEGEIKTKVILVPISLSGHHFALHFVSPA